MTTKTIYFFTKNRYWILIVFSICLFFFLTGMSWLSLATILILTMYVIVRSFNFFNKNYFISLPLTLLAVIVLATLTRLFVFEIYNIPSSSMENALFPGDVIMVSKLNYGPQLPRSPADIPWVNLFFSLNKTASAKSSSDEWAYKRLNGFSKIKQGDIIVFKNILNDKEFLVKRCIGLPGSRLQISNGTVIINNQVSKVFPSVKRIYKVWMNDIKPFTILAKNLYLNYDIKKVNRRQYYSKVVLSADQLILVKALKSIDSVKYEVIKGNAYPSSKQVNWSPDNWGPLLVPAKEMKIPLTKRNYNFYRKVLKMEQKSFQEKKGIYYLNKKPIQTYTFKYDYYFMMGDNRNDSYDSRFWGFLPENEIVGKVILKFFPANLHSKPGLFHFYSLLN